MISCHIYRKCHWNKLALIVEIIQRGEAMGIAKGEARTLRRLLRKRFGELPAWAEEKLAAAKLEAESLEDVLDKDGKGV